jgi:tRNA uridine 5-carbamoylmethylation protein Kti12
MKVINLFGGPGCGKSTIASDVYAAMKWKNINCELVNEYAKELTWSGSHNILKDQLYVFAKQNRKLERIRDQVEWAVTDSPLMLSYVYAQPDYYASFKDIVGDVWNSYENHNFLLKRKKSYHQVGRSQSEEEACEVDVKVRYILKEFNIPHIEINGDEHAKYAIISELGL